MTKKQAIEKLMEAGLDEVQALAQLRMFLEGKRGVELHDAVIGISGVRTLHWAIPMEFNDEPEVIEVLHEIPGRKVYLMGLDPDVEVEEEDVKILGDIKDYDEEDWWHVEES